MISLLPHAHLWLLHDTDGVLRTPGGQPLGSRDQALAVAIREALAKHGPDPSEAWSLYALTCSYLDFAAEDSRCELIDAIVSGLEDDPTYRDLAFRLATGHPDLATALTEPYPIAFLQRIGFTAAWSEHRDGQATVINLPPLIACLRRHLETQPLRRIMALVYAGAHASAPLTVAALLDGAITPAQAAEVLDGSDLDLARLVDLLTFAHAPEDRAEVLAAAAD
jgi:hypothetical protein